MIHPVTERLHDRAKGLDTLAPAEIAQALAAGQCAAAAAVESATAAICGGARAMAETIRSGGRLIYAGAGASGMMAAADAFELHSTFSIPVAQIRVLMAGGLPTEAKVSGAAEDEASGLPADMAECATIDTVIAVAASGTTPYTLAIGAAARASGATLIAIANNADAALLQMADHAVFLPTPPELVAGSTRLGAATAQKIALNSLSTLMAVHLGHIHDGMMINFVANNDKLRRRAVQVVSAIAGVTADQAEASLAAAKGRVKLAALVAAGATSPDTAENLLADTNGNLRAALARL